MIEKVWLRLDDKVVAVLELALKPSIGNAPPVRTRRAGGSRASIPTRGCA